MFPSVDRNIHTDLVSSKRFDLNINADKKKPVERKQAWDYFKKQILPTKKNGELYPIWSTTTKELNDLGPGIQFYFLTLAVLGVMFFVFGILNAYSIFYFQSFQYAGRSRVGISWDLRGSAICEDHELVCLDVLCSLQAIHHKCDLDVKVGILSAVTLFFLMTAFLFLRRKYIGKVHTMYAQVKTAKDYSIVVKDPPGHIKDPLKWAQFFRDVAKSNNLEVPSNIVYITLALDNGDLLKACVKKRIVLKALWETCSPKTNNPTPDELNRGEEEFNRIGRETTDETPKKKLTAWTVLKHFYTPSQDYLINQLIDCCQEIKRLADPKKEYKVVKIYVTFKEAKEQRACLRTLQTGRFQSASDMEISKKSKVPRFEDEILDVAPAPEPEEIEWENLHIPRWKLTLEFGVGLIVYLPILGLLCLALNVIFERSALLAGICIAICNKLLPKLLNLYVRLGKYPTRSLREQSLVLKLIISQWTTTALVVWYITPEDEMLGQEYVTQIQAVLWADAIFTPFLSWLDINSTLKKYVWSRFATDLHDLKTNYFQGTSYLLAERYSNMIKTLFVSLFFLAINPGGLFISAVAFTVNYWVDKYCLLRLWKKKPRYDGSLTEIAHEYMGIAFLICGLAALSLYENWPFDDLCETDHTVSPDVAAASNITNPAIFSRCPENIHTYLLHLFQGQPPKTSAQGEIVFLHRILCLVMLVVFFIFYFGFHIYVLFRDLFVGPAYEQKDSQEINDVEDDESQTSVIQAYVPQILHGGQIIPHLAADISMVDKKHLHIKYENKDLCLQNSTVLSKERQDEIFSRIYNSQQLNSYVENGMQS